MVSEVNDGVDPSVTQGIEGHSHHNDDRGWRQSTKAATAAPTIETATTAES